LIIGPIIAAVGFLLFAVPSVNGSYWRAFFPGFVVLGLGMAVSVAPLTTVVMGAVDQNHAGTASGINNAVARVAGLLAVAILGIVMVSAFSHFMNRSLMQLNLPASAAHELRSNEVQLGALTVPHGLTSDTAAAVERFIAEAFISGFRLIMLICAALGALSAFVAWREIASEFKSRAS
jgi:hypothetical protein